MRALEKEHCHNVLVVAIAPRDAERNIDLEGIGRNARYLCERGVDFIMPACGTGLAYDVTLAEYEAIVGTFMDAAAEAALVGYRGLGRGMAGPWKWGRSRARWASPG